MGSRSKFKNVRVFDRERACWFDSKAEHRRYQELRALERAGTIAQLEIHPKFPLVVHGHKICRYEADFSYVVGETQARVVEDVKGVQTASFRLKAKLLRACHGIDVVVIPAKEC